MMKVGAFIPLVGCPFLNDPCTFPRMEVWQQAAALEVVYKFVQEGKVLGPFQAAHDAAQYQGSRYFFTHPL